MICWQKKHKKWLLLDNTEQLAGIEKIANTWWGTVPPRRVPHISSDGLHTCMRLTEKFIDERTALAKGK